MEITLIALLVATGFFAIGAALTHSSRQKELEKLRDDAAELKKDIKELTARVAMFEKFYDIVEKANTRTNGGAA